MSEPIITFDTEGGSVNLRARYAACDRCHGNGTHTNPNIDGNGLPQECVEDDDFMDDYLGGVYDVTCETCDGKRVVAVPTASNSPAELRAYEAHLADERAYEYERRMGY